MKKIITAFVFCFLCGECFSQAGEWVWIKGDSIPNQPGNYGVQGVPSPTNNPPSLYEPCEWTDLNGNFWLFGGLNNIAGTSCYSDLWKYSVSTNEWTWMKGPGIPNDMGSYGVQGIPSPSNNPSARSWGMASWVDTTGNLWMFGSSSPGTGVWSLSDLWKYDVQLNEWTWMKGPNIPNQSGIYGVQGVASPANNPGCRSEAAASWTSNMGDLWLFGGFRNYSGGVFNDLWRFQISSNQWTWMKGDSAVNGIGIYGAFGIESQANTPESRMSYCSWEHSSGMLYLFGGVVAPSMGNDLWRYNPVTNNWAWFGGGTTYSGNYGTQCVADSGNIPPNRFENRTALKDQDENLWFFGGLDINLDPRNDLWMYCIALGQWIWQSGDSIINPTGSWGIKGVSNPANHPNGRGGALGWADAGHFYFFGGDPSNPYNDLWKYNIDTTCGVCPLPNGIEGNNPPKADELLVFPNPTNSSLTISFSSSEKQNIELRIYNTIGKQIYFSKEEIAKGKFEKEINLKKISDGVCFLQLKTKERLMSRKILVQH